MAEPIKTDDGYLVSRFIKDGLREFYVYLKFIKNPINRASNEGRLAIHIYSDDGTIDGQVGWKVFNHAYHNPPAMFWEQQASIFDDAFQNVFFSHAFSGCVNIENNDRQTFLLDDDLVLNQGRSWLLEQSHEAVQFQVTERMENNVYIEVNCDFPMFLHWADPPEGSFPDGNYTWRSDNRDEEAYDRQISVYGSYDNLEKAQNELNSARNWGIFDIVGGGKFSIFTTCIETIYGITFMVLAPDGDIVKGLMDRVQNKEEVQAYIDETLKKNDMDRTELNKGKSGCELKGVTCINPVNGKEVRMFIGDFVLASYGTGAVMAVPTHDQRDFEYAQVHNIEMIQVIDGDEKLGHVSVEEKAFEKHDYLGKGYKLINSDEFDGLTVEEAKEAITVKLEKMGVAKRTVNYHFREWIFARQRYWGEPVPVVHGEDGQIHTLDDSELPLVLPELEDYKGKNGQAPLENATEWKNYDANGIKGKRETSTMPGSAGSSWYFLRYIDPDNENEFANQELLKHWMPVDLYIGGPEHAVGHLMYSRIWNRYLYDKGLAPTKEPFQKLVHQGMILGENGIKMGKRFPEFVVNPSDIVRDYGADTLRLYEMFMGPLEVSKPWSKQGVEGARRFINRVWTFFTNSENLTDEAVPELEKVYHQTVKKVSDDFEQLAFNTAISQMMIFVNAVYKVNKCPKEYAEGIIKMLSCITPHLGEEIWSIFGHDNTIAYEPWPVYDEEKIKEDTIEIGVQVNGKLKGTIQVGVDEGNDSAIAKAHELPYVKNAVEGKTIVKEIYVKGRIVNIVVK